MTFRQLEHILEKLAAHPEFGTSEYEEWLKFEDAVEFLTRTTRGLIPIYVSMSDIYIYSVLTPQERMINNYIDDIMKWNFGPSSGWGYGLTNDEHGKPKKMLYSPLEHTGSRVFNGSEPIFFLRYFEGCLGKKSYPELNQKVAHILDIHWMPERSAYCRLDRLGDYQDIIIIKNTDQGIVCALDSDALELYMFLTDTVLVRLFGLTRCHDWSNFMETDRETTLLMDSHTELYARRTIAIGRRQKEAAWLRGFQIIRRARNNNIMFRLLQGEEIEPKQYATFIVLDWKHGVVREWSCSPELLGNYFEESDLPYETSPAFFRPEVLSKYKQDPDKYKVESRIIYCRGAWSLRYDINEEGQVYVYLRDLGALPYKEQLYWRSFNELPKAGISSRAWKTDFLAEWDTDYDPLESLKDILSHFPSTSDGTEVWKPDPERLARLSYVVTDSVKEWEDQILQLAIIIVDGLNKKAIKAIAKELGCFDKELGSIKLLRECLIRGIPEEQVTQIIEPLTELWELRSHRGIAHRGDRPSVGSLREHYRELLSKCDRAMRLLADLIEAKVLDKGLSGAKQ